MICLQWRLIALVKKGQQLHLVYQPRTNYTYFQC